MGTFVSTPEERDQKRQNTANALAIGVAIGLQQNINDEAEEQRKKEEEKKKLDS